MYTLKVKWFRTDEGKLADEATYFIPADSVSIHGSQVKSREQVNSEDQFSHFAKDAFIDYRHVNYEFNSDAEHTIKNEKKMSGVLVEVNRDNKPTEWYVVSSAWLLGPDGKTIERLA